MADLRVRNIEEWVMDALRARAQRHGHFLADEIRGILREEAMRPKRELADKLARMREELREKYGTFSDSAALIREDRDSRG